MNKKIEFYASVRSLNVTAIRIQLKKYAWKTKKN